MRKQPLSFILMYLKDELEATSPSTGEKLKLIIPEDQWLDLRPDQFCIAVAMLTPHGAEGRKQGA